MKKITLIFMLLLSLQGFSQLALQDFEGTWTPLTTAEGPAGPAGWYIKNVQGPAFTWSQGTGAGTQPAYQGSHSAYLNKESISTGTPEDWLITPQFNVPANGQLKFFSRLTSNGDQGTTYKVMIGTDPTNAASFTLLQNWTELTLNPSQLVYTEEIVNIPATYSGQQLYIAFIMTGNDGDKWLIDNVQVIEQCFAPTALTANPTGTSSSLSWTSTATAFEVEVVPNGTAFTNVGVAYTGTLPYITPATLTPSTTYQYQVRAQCSPGNYSPWAGPFTFTTSQIPGTLPYTEGFEGSIQWAFNNGTQANQWFSGTATNNGGTHSIYVSNDLGVTNAYTVAPDTATSTVQAYRDIQMPAAVDQLTLSFDWKAFGESCCDFLRVWLVPASFTPTAGTQITAANSGGVQIGGNFNVNGTWTTNSTIINGTAFAGTVRRLVFEWHNDFSVGTQPPAAIDNVNLSLITCPAPANLALASLTNTNANFTWTGPTSVTPTFDYYYSNTNTAPVAGTTPTGNVATPSFSLTPLTPSTTYFFWVRSNCGTGDASTWTGPVSFTTPQIPATLNYSQDFEGTPGWGFTNGTQTNQWVLGTATSNSPTHSLYISNDNGATYTYTNTATTTVQAYRDILIPTGTAEVNLSFDWKANGESCCDFLRVWLVPVTFTPTAGTQITTGNSGGVQIGANFNVNSNWVTFLNTVNVSAFAGGMRRLVFEWHNDGSIGTIPAAIDNVNITIVTCPKPTALTAVVSSTSASLGWTAAGTETSWEVYVVPTGSAAPTATTVGTTVTTNPYTYGPLSPITTYQFYVRALCSTSDKSLWAGPFSFTTSVTNDNCSGAITLPVNTGQACTQVTPAAFTGANASALAACTGANGPDIWFQFTAIQASQTIALSGFTIVNTNAQNVVLGLYDGSCGSLTTPIFCSNNNIINATGLTPGTVYLLRATLSPTGTTAPNLSTAFNICISTPPPPSASNQSDCLISTINPSFEVPATITNGLNNVTISQNVVPGWRTTATDGMIEFWPVPNNQGVTAAAGTSGTWFIELNANQSAAVYQDFSTPQPTTFTVQFAHRGRQGVDTMRLKAGNANDPITGYTQIGPNFSDGIGAWTYYGQGGTLTYTVPAGQTTTRFVFEAVSTSTGDPTIGNFLDEIRFTANNGILSANPVTIDCATPTTNISAAGGGTWTAHSDNPGPSVIANPTANNTTISGFTTQGVYHYDWTTDYCTSTLTLTYNGLAIAEPVTTTAINYCEGATATQLTATALTGYTLHWYDVATGGTELAAAPTPNTATAGVTTYYVSQSLAICEGPRAAITVTVNEVPVAPTSADATYCQNATATALTATGDPANTINWYTVATGGTPLAGAPTPDTSILGAATYYVAQQTPAGCESPRTQVNVLITTPQTPVTSFTYTTPVCIAGTNPVPTTPAGFATGGTFTAPAGVAINAATGEIDLTSTPAGTYTITYTVAANPTTCSIAGTDSATITITPLAIPVTGFTYTNVCTSAANQLPTLATGFATGGTYTSSDAALVVDPLTGEINVAGSTPGTYTVTYAVVQDNTNCTAAGSTPATITIAPLATPITAFSYVNSCTLQPNQLPVTATGFATGGTFTASAVGLVIDPVTGEITTATSSAGTYTVTYTVVQDNTNCTAAATNTATITITAPAVAVTGFTYANICSTTASELPVLDPGFTAGGIFTVSSGLTIDPVTGALTLPANAGGTYTITYTIPQDVTNCVAGVTNTASIVITTALVAETGFDYDSTYCFGSTSASPTFTTGFDTNGTFSSTGGLNINPATGSIDLSNVQAGTYTVTYTVAPDPATCNLGGTSADTFTVGSQLEFSLEGNCNGDAYVITSKPTNSSFDPSAVTYEWTVGGTPAGTDSASFNVSEYVNGTQVIETFPFDVALTVVNSDGCPTPVTFTVNDISCTIQKGISPGDGKDNDYFDLAYMGVAKLTIFNRYGLEVYSKHNYTVEWHGQTNSGDELPTGTYFYVIDKNVGDTKTGWIYINRQN